MPCTAQALFRQRIYAASRYLYRLKLNCAPYSTGIGAKGVCNDASLPNYALALIPAIAARAYIGAAYESACLHQLQLAVARCSRYGQYPIIMSPDGGLIVGPLPEGNFAPHYKRAIPQFQLKDAAPIAQPIGVVVAPQEIGGPYFCIWKLHQHYSGAWLRPSRRACRYC